MAQYFKVYTPPHPPPLHLSFMLKGEKTQSLTLSHKQTQSVSPCSHKEKNTSNLIRHLRVILILIHHHLSTLQFTTDTIEFTPTNQVSQPRTTKYIPTRPHI